MLAQRTETAGKPRMRPGDTDAVGASDGEADIYAGVVTRAIAMVLDILVIGAAALAVAGAVALVFAVFALSNKHHAVVAVIAGAAFGVWVIVYFVSFWTTTGQTPGNRVMHICVTRSDGARLRPLHALIRLGAMVLSLPLFWGFWPILTSPRRRGVPDAMAGTVVVVADGDGEEAPA